MCPVRGMHSLIHVQCADSKQPDPQAEDLLAQIMRIAAARLLHFPNVRKHFARTSLLMYAHRSESAEILFNHHLQVHTHGLALPTLLLIIICNTIVIIYTMVVKEHTPVLAFVPTSERPNGRHHCCGPKTKSKGPAKRTCFIRVQSHVDAFRRATIHGRVQRSYL